MSKGSVEKKHISMYPEDWEVVERVNHALRLGNTSGALRFIVTQFAKEWPEAKAQPAPDSATPTPQPM
jgi:hypothetical protein